MVMVQHFDERGLCALDDIPDGGALAVDAVAAAGGRDLVLLREGGRVAVFENACPHAGRRLDWAPGEFLLGGGIVTCAAHGAAFDARTGACKGGACRGEGLRAVACRISEGRVWLDERD